MWTALVSLPLASAVQETAARLGLVGGRGLIALIRDRFGRPVVLLVTALVVVANTFNIGADLGAMADALGLLVPLPFTVLVIALAGVILALEILLPYERYALLLRWLALSIGAYLVEILFVEIDWSAVAAGLVPSLPSGMPALEALVAIFGTTISPYLFVWQAGEEVEERRAGRIGRIDRRQLRAMRVDVVSGMTAGVVVMFAIMVTSAATLGARGVEVATAADAAKALEPIAGRFASVVFAAGIVGTGLLAIPTLAGSAAYALAETFGWREGLTRTPRQAPGFNGVIAASIALGLVMNLVGVDPIRALFLAAIVNGLAAPPLILLMLVLSSSRGGRLRRGGRLSFALVAAAFLLMSVCALVYLAALAFG